MEIAGPSRPDKTASGTATDGLQTVLSSHLRHRHLSQQIPALLWCGLWEVQTVSWGSRLRIVSKRLGVLLRAPKGEIPNLSSAEDQSH
jgi:hypothetical protein